MSTYTLHGSRLGGASHPALRAPDNVDDGTVAPTARVTYGCPRGHVTTLTIHEEAPVPPQWDCGTCFATAALTTDVHPERLAEAPAGPSGPRGANAHTPAHEGAWFTTNHIQQLHARRTDAELEALLEDRLTALRSRRSAQGAR